jgi:hypothetical protein
MYKQVKRDWSVLLFEVELFLTPSSFRASLLSH